MGLDYNMRTENYGLDRDYPGIRSLERNIGGFISGGSISLSQMNQVLGVDLSFLTVFNDTETGLENTVEEHRELVEYLLSETTDEEEIKKIKAEAEEEYKNIQNAWDYAKKNNWIDLDVVEENLEKLIAVFEQKKPHLEKLEMDSLARHYLFKESTEDFLNFQDDMKNILKFVKNAKSRGMNKFALYIS
jgi:hypothetical protein